MMSELEKVNEENTMTNEECTPLNPEVNLKAVLEGLLFIVGDEGIQIDRLQEVMAISKQTLFNLIEELEKDYEDSNKGIQLVQFGEYLRIITKPCVAEYAKELFQLTKKNTLSPAALETLAIIAYKQPITRVEIEEIRGVGADMMLRKLLARDLIQEAGRSEAPGRPILYEVTEEFMNSFQLISLDELPELPKFANEESEELFD